MKAVEMTQRIALPLLAVTVDEMTHAHDSGNKPGSANVNPYGESYPR